MENIFEKENIVEIKPMGSYFEVDENGYLINPTSIEKIQADWKPAIADIVEEYKKEFGEKLKNVYVRGSVAKGQAVKYISDIDTFAGVDLVENEINNGWIKEISEKLKEKYPFVEGFELSGDPIVELSKDIILLNQSVCVFGEPIIVAKMKPGKDMMLHLLSIERSANKIETFLEKDESVEEIKNACRWLMKNILRSGFELSMMQSGRYTRDLYLCYKDFAEYYPEYESVMREALHYALNPTDDKDKIKEIKDEIVPFLIQESKKFLK